VCKRLDAFIAARLPHERERWEEHRESAPLRIWRGSGIAFQRL
jgi:hypothetical protein